MFSYTPVQGSVEDSEGMTRVASPNSVNAMQCVDFQEHLVRERNIAPGSVDMASLPVVGMWS